MSKPLFLVYTDNPMCSIDCADSVCEVLNQTGIYDAKLIGPDSYPKIDLDKKALKNADCLVMPGGLGDADQFDEKLLDKKELVVDYVKNGGRYLGICMGGYFASCNYFDILTNAKAVQYIKQKDSTIKRANHDVVRILWNGTEKCSMYFHDGAAFVPVKSKYIPAKIMGIYENGQAAAMMQPYGRGKVGVIGPHPEAQKWWFYCQKRITDRWHDSVQHERFLEFVKKLIK